MPVDLKVQEDRRARLRLHEQLDLLSLPTPMRRRVVRKMALEVRKGTRANIRAQKTVSGAAMEPRKAGRARRKMLRGLGRGMRVRVTSPESAEVGWPNRLTSHIAYRHQTGQPETWTAGKARKVYGVPDYKSPATRAQAKSLIAEGYRLRVRKQRGKGCALRRVSQRWIRENLSLGQAGVILRMMRDGKRKGKQRWEMRTPARPFLGVDPAKYDEALNDIARQALAAVRKAKR